jgi:hypothetical protein
MSRKPNVLSHRELVRSGERDKSGFRTGRLSVDFIVDGRSLLETLDRKLRRKSDLMGCFVAGYPDANKAAQARLVTRRKPNSPEGRVLLYICPECGDVGCGAYAARVERRGDHFRWGDFAYESAGDTLPIKASPAFLFEARAYRSVIAAAAAQLSVARAPRRRAAGRR